MHRGLGLLLAFAATVILAVTAPVAVPSPRVVPSVRVVDLRPFTIRGERFAPAERVTVVATVVSTHRRTVRASRAGSFLVRFREYAEACTAYNLRVVGSSGSRVTLAKKPPPTCAALDPP
jgi:hypothetical protein